MVAEIRGFSTALFDCEVVEIANTDPAISEYETATFSRGFGKMENKCEVWGRFYSKKVVGFSLESRLDK